MQRLDSLRNFGDGFEKQPDYEARRMRCVWRLSGLGIFTFAYLPWSSETLDDLFSMLALPLGFGRNFLWWAHLASLALIASNEGTIFLVDDVFVVLETIVE